MYRYDDLDQAFIDDRTDQFADQVSRRLDGKIGEDHFKPLRLMNGLYLQLHAYMLRVAIPYGTLSSEQMRGLAAIARQFDRGYGHFTTRQNIQFNWTRLDDMPDILATLAEMQMHAVQTSGNCIRNVTADHLAGVAPDELEDPRPWCEIIRQWSSLHPEFTYLPRKFKIAVGGGPRDRAALKVHDIALELRRNASGEVGFAVMVGGGQGRTPKLAKTIRDFLPKRHLLSYLEAILRVYNQLGRRDNKYKARIKILVDAVGADRFADMVEEEWSHLRDGDLTLEADDMAKIIADFAPPAYDSVAPAATSDDPAFAHWRQRNVHGHKVPGYVNVTVSLKPIGGAPGDATEAQMEAVADLAERWGSSEIRVSHEQNLILPDIREADLLALWQGLDTMDLATPNAGLITDIISCPGLDYCALATARSIPIAQAISERFADLERQHDIGELKLKISGCINACGHHHIGHIGILGVDKRGTEVYQVTLGGNAAEDASLGQLVGPGFAADEIVDAVETIVTTYLGLRHDGESFLDAYRRVGLGPFKDALYAPA
ncbi:MAG: nitrite/sulfite reductase [Alphaproteobacteria bacterium]|jgi:sulfite reductase (NADPH) hemoprotein beta-component|nr:nitrite/sulfite reductase [Alphaproteobacteria bacterium]